MDLVKNTKIKNLGHRCKKPTDCYEWLQRLQCLQHLLALESNIQGTFNETKFTELQSLLCFTLQCVLKEMSPAEVSRISDAMMATLLQMFSSTIGDTGSLQKDVVVTVSTLVKVLDDKSARYLITFGPFLASSLKNHAEYQVFSAALCLIRNICRALRSQVLPYSDNIMAVLLEKLSSSSLHHSLKPQILSLFGDVAIAVGPRFTKHIRSVLQVLSETSSDCTSKSDRMTVECQNGLWQGCLDAYTGMIQALIEDKDSLAADVQLVLPHVPLIAIIITVSSVSISRSDIKIASCAELIGNLCTVFGAEILPLVDTKAIHKLLNLGRHSKTTKTKTLASSANKKIKKLKGGASW